VSPTSKKVQKNVQQGTESHSSPVSTIPFPQTGPVIGERDSTSKEVKIGFFEVVADKEFGGRVEEELGLKDLLAELVAFA